MFDKMSRDMAHMKAIQDINMAEISKDLQITNEQIVAAQAMKAEQLARKMASPRRRHGYLE